MSFEIITEIWTYWLNEMSLESITEGLTYFNQRYDVWEHYRNLNISHSTRCRLRALQKSELIALTISRLRALQKYERIALNHVSFESITEIWTYCTQRYIVWEHYRNLNLLHSMRCRLRALQKSELIALNDMSFGSITAIWTYCTQRDVVWGFTVIWTYCTRRDVVCGLHRNLNLLYSARCRLRSLEIWTYWLNEMSLESITEGLTYFNQRYDVYYRNLNISHSTRCRLRALQKSELIALTISRLRALQKYERIALNHVSFESITEIWTYCTQRYVVWEHYSNLNLLHSTRCRLRALQKSGLIALNGM